jgi:hypothetical protein
VAGDRAELTGTIDAAGSSTATVERTAGVGGRWRGFGRTRRARERGRGGSAEGASERGEVGEQGAGAGTWPENARTWARPRQGIVGERLGTADRWGRRDRERERARGKGTAPIDRPHRAARGRGEERARGRDRLIGGVRLSTRAGARAI